MQRLIGWLFFLITAFLFADERLNLPSTIGHIPSNVLKNIEGHGKQFIHDLEDVLNEETEELFILVDKEHPLSSDYAPHKLVELTNNSQYVVNKKGLKLTPVAEKALSNMAKVALSDGVNLLVSSAYRSYQYQKNLFDR